MVYITQNANGVPCSVFSETKSYVRKTAEVIVMKYFTDVFWCEYIKMQISPPPPPLKTTIDDSNGKEFM